MAQPRARLTRVDCAEAANIERVLSLANKKFIDDSFLPTKPSLGDVGLEYLPPWKLASCLVRQSPLQALTGPLPIIELALKSRPEFYDFMVQAKDHGMFIVRVCRAKVVTELAVD